LTAKGTLHTAPSSPFGAPARVTIPNTAFIHRTEMEGFGFTNLMRSDHLIARHRVLGVVQLLLLV
jgi:hypothetical protein